MCNHEDSMGELQRNDPANPSSFKSWSHYRDEDRRSVPGYLKNVNKLDCVNLKTEVSVERYLDPEYAKKEKKNLWERVWQAACRENEVPEIGDYFEYEICGISIIIIRADGGKIEAFRNHCRHRGAALIEGEGNVKAFTCAFHGWTYDLQGNLVAIPAEWNFPKIDKKCHGLQKCSVDLFNGWIFVNLDTSPVPLNQFLSSDLRDEMLVHPENNMHKIQHIQVMLPCNWKVAVEGFLESLHVGVLHPSLSPISSDIQSEFSFFDLHHRYTNPFAVPAIIPRSEYSQNEIVENWLEYSEGRFSDNLMNIDHISDGSTNARHIVADILRSHHASNGLNYNDVSDAELIDSIAYFVFPNILWGHSPAGRQCIHVRPNGDKIDECLFEYIVLAPVPADTPLPRDLPRVRAVQGKRFSDYKSAMGPTSDVFDEDNDMARLVQKGMKSGVEWVNFGLPLESGIANFHRNIDKWVNAA